MIISYDHCDCFNIFFGPECIKHLRGCYGSACLACLNKLYRPRSRSQHLTCPKFASLGLAPNGVPHDTNQWTCWTPNHPFWGADTLQTYHHAAPYICHLAPWHTHTHTHTSHQPCHHDNILKRPPSEEGRRHPGASPFYIHINIEFSTCHGST